MQTLRSDLGCYSRIRNGKLDGLSANYVDDMLRTGTLAFFKLCSLTGKKFEMAKYQNIPFRFTAFLISRDSAGTLQLDQVEYTKELRLLPEDCDFSAFASMRMKLMWLSHSRPYCIFEISQMMQVTRDHFAEEHRSIVKTTNRVIKYATGQIVKIRFPALQCETLKVVGYSDASFANNRDHTSKLGYIVFLTDASSRVVLIIYKS